MQHRLKRYEKEAIKRQYKDNALYIAFAPSCNKYEARPDSFNLSPEELFWNIVEVLDHIKENPSESRFFMQNMWDEKVSDFQEQSRQLSRHAVVEAANIVTLCTAICLNSLNYSLFNTLALVAIGQLQGDADVVNELRETFMSNIYRFGETRFSDAVAKYMDSDVFLSDDIEELLTLLPEPENLEREDDSLGIKAVLEALHTRGATESPVWLIDEKGAKIDIIRVLNVLYELGKFKGKDGAKLTKKDFFATMGKAMNIDLSNYDKHLSRSTSDSTKLEKHLRIFDEMRQKMESIWNSK